MKSTAAWRTSPIDSRTVWSTDVLDDCSEPNSFNWRSTWGAGSVPALTLTTAISSKNVIVTVNIAGDFPLPSNVTFHRGPLMKPS